MTQLFDPHYQAVDSSGNPLVGALLYFYQSGTTTTFSIYQEVGLSTPHANPVVADASGRFAPIYLNTDPYKIVLKTSGGTTIQTADAIPLLASSSIVGADLTALEALSSTGIAARTASNTWAQRTMTAGTGLTITNGAGIAGNPTFTPDIASTANVRASTASKLLTTDNVYAGAAEVALSDAATIAVDGSTFINASVTLAGNRTLGTMSNPVVGRTGRIRVTQDGTGSRTLAYHADYEFASGSAVVLSTAIAAQDLLYYDVIASGRILISAIKAIA